MPFSLSDILDRTFQDVVIGGPLFDPTTNVPNMVVYPIFPTDLSDRPTDVITLKQGLRKGVRLSDTGVVSQVHIHNPLPAAILVGESDILIGPTQLRSVQFSCLIPPGRRASLPVNCVEAGQPTVFQAEFNDAEACPWFLRSFKMEQLARHGESHQHRIWEHIKDYLRSTGTESSTQDISAVFDEFGGDVERFSELFPLQPGQVGCVCAVGQDLFCEYFSAPEVLEDRYELVLRSATVEAVAHPTHEVIPSQHVDSLLQELAEASQGSKVVHSRSLQDGGRTQVFHGRGISGSGLVSGGELVHLTAHKRCWGQGQMFSEQLPDLEQDRKLRIAEQRDLLRRLADEYSSRRRQYRSYLKGVKPASVSASRRALHVSVDDDQFSDDNPTPPPLPLNPGLHEFFLRLFRK
ncbi:MAG: DUF6569 family protein [Candidatus Latescibacterota bacterium]|nr:DUF6569 family protein [Candidatus Latescibacterota bacterium]